MVDYFSQNILIEFLKQFIVSLISTITFLFGASKASNTVSQIVSHYWNIGKSSKIM